MALYCSIRGILADFDRHVFEMFDVHPNDIDSKELFDLIDKNPDFWEKLPLRSDAKHLWREIENFDPVLIATGPVKFVSKVGVGFGEWVRNNFGGHVEVVSSKDSDIHKLCQSEGDVLIDTRDAVCRRWYENGGGAVVHHTAHETIKSLTDHGVIW